jgi:hypothetical protein
MKPVKDLPEPLRAILGGSDYVWCRVCHRTFTRDEATVDDPTFDKAAKFLNEKNASRLAEGVERHMHCPLAKCGAPFDVVSWKLIRLKDPQLPDTPEEGCVYEDTGY